MTCPRCKREVQEWPLKRGDRCAPADWVYCIRPREAVVERVVREVIDLLAQSRSTFRSKQIERARRLLENLLEKN